jgi:hypothetical protein
MCLYHYSKTPRAKTLELIKNEISYEKVDLYLTNEGQHADISEWYLEMDNFIFEV